MMTSVKIIIQLHLKYIFNKYFKFELCFLDKFHFKLQRKQILLAHKIKYSSYYMKYVYSYLKENYFDSLVSK
jgi:hypothetical protein